MAKKQETIQVDGRELTISNVGKVFYPESSFTKGEVIAFYAEIGEVILPHLHDRPLTLKRYPDGVTGEHFYEKNAPKYKPAWVKTFAVPRSEGGTDIQYVLCNDRATLLWATNLGDIEKHVLLARAPDLHRPTSLVFDLDPGEPAGMLECVAVAFQLRELFLRWNLESFVKVSGSKARRGDALTAEKMNECRWLKPTLVCQLAFVEWTDAGHLRHATFVAMRDDRVAKEVARET